MKITAVNTYFVRPRWGFVEIETDAGYTGWGEAVLVAFVASIFGALLTQATSSLNINVENLDLPPVVLRILMIYASGVSMLSLVQFILGGTVRLGYATYLLKQYDRRDPRPMTCSVSLIILVTLSA